MPYDPRPESKGGNRGMGERFTHVAPKGKYRVVCVDTFDGGDWVAGDFDTRGAAIACAKENGGEMLKAHVYDDTGKHVLQTGTF